MTGTRIPSLPRRPPAGRRSEGERFVDDGYGLVIRDQLFDCGGRRIRHEYHDGSIHPSAVRHDGERVKDPIEPDHGS
jgi:hypothetical protein